MKAKNLVSMLLAGSMILGLAACAPTREQPDPRRRSHLHGWHRDVLGLPGLQRG